MLLSKTGRYVPVAYGTPSSQYGAAHTSLFGSVQAYISMVFGNVAAPSQQLLRIWVGERWRRTAHELTAQVPTAGKDHALRAAHAALACKLACAAMHHEHLALSSNTRSS